MISGPDYPRSRAGLWALIERHLHAIERGLELVARELQLDDCCGEVGESTDRAPVIDALAKDASGRPVLLVGYVPQEDGSIAGRILGARSWLLENRELLPQLLPVRGLDYDRPMRLMVVCRELPAEAREHLEALRIDELEVAQIRTLRVGGELRVGVVRPVGGRGGNAFALPDGLAGPGGALGPKPRAVALRLLDLMRRLDPDIRASGDRYAKRFDYAGARLAEMQLRDGGVWLTVPGDPGGADHEIELVDEDSCMRAVDRAMRRYLALGDGADCRALPGDLDPTARGAGRPDLGPIRETIAEARLSQEECAALQDPRHQQQARNPES